MLKLHSLIPDVSRSQTPAMNTYAAFIDITGVGSNYCFGDDQTCIWLIVRHKFTTRAYSQLN